MVLAGEERSVALTAAAAGLIASDRAREKQTITLRSQLMGPCISEPDEMLVSDQPLPLTSPSSLSMAQIIGHANGE
jgi:hypothetical protein